MRPSFALTCLLMCAALLAASAEPLSKGRSRKLLTTATENASGTASGDNANVAVTASATVGADGAATIDGKASGQGNSTTLTTTGQITDGNGNTVKQQTDSSAKGGAGSSASTGNVAALGAGGKGVTASTFGTASGVGPSTVSTTGVTDVTSAGTTVHQAQSGAADGSITKGGHSAVASQTGVVSVDGAGGATTQQTGFAAGLGPGSGAITVGNVNVTQAGGTLLVNSAGSGSGGSSQGSIGTSTDNQMVTTAMATGMGGNAASTTLDIRQKKN